MSNFNKVGIFMKTFGQEVGRYFMARTKKATQSS